MTNKELQKQLVIANRTQEDLRLENLKLRQALIVARDMAKAALDTAFQTFK